MENSRVSKCGHKPSPHITISILYLAAPNWNDICLFRTKPQNIVRTMYPTKSQSKWTTKLLTKCVMKLSGSDHTTVITAWKIAHTNVLTPWRKSALSHFRKMNWKDARQTTCLSGCLKTWTENEPDYMQDKKAGPVSDNKCSTEAKNMPGKILDNGRADTLARNVSVRILTMFPEQLSECVDGKSPSTWFTPKWCHTQKKNETWPHDVYKYCTWSNKISAYM